MAGSRDPRAQGCRLRATLAANQQESRAALAANLAAAGQSDPDDRAGAIITVCDGLIVDFLLYGQASTPKDIARQAAKALASLEG